MLALACQGRPQFVIAGLDPAIHLGKRILRRSMDARIKSGHDEKQTQRDMS
jgi:hypothetical protein